jgi:hypothetical protein
LTKGGRQCNGTYEPGGLRAIQRSNDTFVLTLNCNEHRLSIGNADGKEQDEMKIDGLHAPFPWCIFVQTNRIGGRVSLL